MTSAELKVGKCANEGICECDLPACLYPGSPCVAVASTERTTAAAPQASANLLEGSREGGPDTGTTDREDAKPGHAGACGAALSSSIGMITAEPITTHEQLEAVYQQAIRGRHISEIALVLALRNKALDAFSSATGTLEVPEGCTPTDAMVLREANAVFAEENHHLRRCLRWYANGEHYTGFLNWEGPSGDDNWLCPPPGDGIFADERLEFIEKMDEAMVEDGSVARSTLISGKFQVESPEEEPKLVPGEPEWKIEQEAKAAGRTDGARASK